MRESSTEVLALVFTQIVHVSLILIPTQIFRILNPMCESSTEVLALSIRVRTQVRVRVRVSVGLNLRGEPHGRNQGEG